MTAPDLSLKKIIVSGENPKIHPASFLQPQLRPRGAELSHFSWPPTEIAFLLIFFLISFAHCFLELGHRSGAILQEKKLQLPQVKCW